MSQQGGQSTQELAKMQVEETKKDFSSELQGLSVEEIKQKIKLIESNISDNGRLEKQLKNDINIQNKTIDELKKTLVSLKKLPYLVSSVAEIFDMPPEQDVIQQEDDYKGKSVVIQTSLRQTIFLPNPGLVEATALKPGENVGVWKDAYLIMQTLPNEFDTRAKAMEVEEKPNDDYTDIGGLDKQIQELREAIVLPITHKEQFDAIGIRPPKGVLMHGPPGTGKTMMARACAAQTKATFLKLAGPHLVQMYIGDGAKIVRDAFELAREKSPAIIFIDELDAIGAKRGGEDDSREVQRTLIELLNQLDGFTPDEQVKVIAATNRPDILDPALLRSGRLDRKIEFPLPNQEARVQVMRIHSRKMNVGKEVNFQELARSTEDFNCAQLKAVVVEAGMSALRRNATSLHHEDYIQGIAAVLSQKQTTLNYFA